MTTHPALANALAPVREALLADAEREARRLRSSSEQAGRDAVREATAQAERLRARARAEGAADAAAVMAAQRARSGQRARSVVLSAQREEYEALQSAARAALPRLRADAEYPRLRQRMIDTIKLLLGNEADLREGDGGGVIGEAAGRRVDCSLTRFMERAVDAELAEPGVDGELAERAGNGERERR